MSRPPHVRTALAVSIAALLAAVSCSGSGETGGAGAPGAPGADGGPSDRPPLRTRTVETRPMRIDRIYGSMQGPYDQVFFEVDDLDWVAALRTEVVDAGSGDKLGDELFCHSQLQQLNATRLMVTATGSEEIRFPEGFAMPVTRILSGLPPDQRKLTMLGMVLNNHEPDMDRDVRVRATVEYWTDEDLEGRAPPKKLYKVGLAMSVRHLEEIETAEGLFTAADANAQCVTMPGYDTHWIVPPGPQTTRMRWWDFLPIDATVHYAVVHLHNYGVYFRLTDVTTGEMLWETRVVNEPDRMQISRIPVYSSAEGFPIFADHEYEIEAHYDNTSGRDVDAMASIYLYYHPSRDVDISYPHPPAAPGASSHGSHGS
jgi:hypothetical protein